MKTRPRKPTRQQSEIAAELHATEEFASAQQLHARMRQQGSSIGLATVYRTLTALAEQDQVDVLHTSDGESLYRACSTGHHHHLVCRKCGRTVEVDGPAVEQWADAVAAEHGFTEVAHTVEVFGTCSEH